MKGEREEEQDGRGKRQNKGGREGWRAEIVQEHCFLKGHFYVRLLWRLFSSYSPQMSLAYQQDASNPNAQTTYQNLWGETLVR